MSQVVHCDGCNDVAVVKTSKIVPDSWWWAQVGPFVVCSCTACAFNIYRTGKRRKKCRVCKTKTRDRVQMTQPETGKISVCRSCVFWRPGSGFMRDLEVK